MRILILGCDKLGSYLAAVLMKEGHAITAMDTNADLLDSLPRGPQLETVLASDSLIEELRGIGIHHLDVFLALSEDDTRNVMAAQIASHIFHVPEVICLINDPQREEFYKGLGLNVVCPARVVVGAIRGALEDTREAVQG